MEFEVSITNNQGKTFSAGDGQWSEDSVENMREFISDLTARISLEVLHEAQRTDGFTKKPKVIVDGRLGVSPYAVKPFGKIIYAGDLNAAMTIAEMYLMIEKRSPVRTGQYLDANYVFINGRLVATNLGSLNIYLLTAKISKGDRIRFVNVTPYASRLEYKGVRRSTTGKSAGQNVSAGSATRKGASGGVVKRPNGVYEVSYRAISRKYKKHFQSMTKGFMKNGTNGVTITSSGPFRTTYHPRNKKYSGSYVYPYIALVVGDQGLAV